MNNVLDKLPYYVNNKEIAPLLVKSELDVQTIVNLNRFFVIKMTFKEPIYRRLSSNSECGKKVSNLVCDQNTLFFENDFELSFRKRGKVFAVIELDNISKFDLLSCSRLNFVLDKSTNRLKYLSDRGLELLIKLREEVESDIYIEKIPVAFKKVLNIYLKNNKCTIKEDKNIEYNIIHSTDFLVITKTSGEKGIVRRMLIINDLEKIDIYHFELEAIKKEIETTR